MCYVSCTAPRAQGPISATHPSSLSVAAAPQAQSLGHPVLRKRGWWPARLSQPQKPPEQVPQIACLDPGIHRGEGSMMAWLGTALPTKWGTQRAGSGPSSQVSVISRRHMGPISFLLPQGLLGERRASSRAQWPAWDCLPASKQRQEHSAPSGQARWPQRDPEQEGAWQEELGGARECTL